MKSPSKIKQLQMFNTLRYGVILLLDLSPHAPQPLVVVLLVLMKGQYPDSNQPSTYLP